METKIEKIVNTLISESQNKINDFKTNYPNFKPHVTVILTNDSSESSSYVKHKLKAFEENGIVCEVLNLQTLEELDQFQVTNSMLEATSIIPQLPLGRGFKGQETFINNLIPAPADIDRLQSVWLYSTDDDSLPVTALGMKRLIDKLLEEKPDSRILLYGNGLTTNRNLYLNLFQQGYRVRHANSKTGRYPSDLRGLLDWADIIVSATGIPEILEVENKVVISPTLVKTENGWRSDLKQELREKNQTHKVLGCLGKLTTTYICERAWTDAIKRLKQK